MNREPSPIEIALTRALLDPYIQVERQLFVDDHSDAELEFRDGKLYSDGRPLRPTSECVWLCPQVRVGAFSLDLMLWSHSVLAIECDGHDWHERTPEQAAHDRRRDRTVLRAGVPTIRFTGREIVRDPAGCALEVLDTFLALERRRRGIEENAPLRASDVESAHRDGVDRGWANAMEHIREAMSVDLKENA